MPVDVQKEHGHSPIAHPIMEALALAPFSASHLKVLLHVIRQTYGWSRKDAAISYGDFCAATDMHKETVRKTLKSLLGQGVLVEVEPATFQSPATYRLQKHPDEWGIFRTWPMSGGQSNERRTPQRLTDRTVRQMTDRGVSQTADSDDPQVVDAATDCEGLKQGKAKESKNTIHPSSREDPPGETATPIVPDTERFIDRTIVLANRGMNDNPNVGPHAPIEVGHGPSRQAVADWLEAGMSREAIETAVYDAAKRYRPTASRRRISSLTYFRGAVRDEQNRIDANQVEVPHGSNPRSRHDGGAPAQGRGEAPRARSKYDHLVERSSPS